MNDQRADDPSQVRRRKRLELQMKENLKRRKAQARARRDAEAPGQTPDGPPPKAPGEETE